MPRECEVAQREVQVPRLLSPAEDKLLLAQQLAGKKFMAESTKQMRGQRSNSTKSKTKLKFLHVGVCEQGASLLGASRGEVYPLWEQLLLPGRMAAVWRGLWSCWSLT